MCHLVSRRYRKKTTCANIFSIHCIFHDRPLFQNVERFYRCCCCHSLLQFVLKYLFSHSFRSIFLITFKNHSKTPRRRFFSLCQRFTISVRLRNLIALIRAVQSTILNISLSVLKHQLAQQLQKPFFEVILNNV